MKKLLAALAALAVGALLALGVAAPAQARAKTETPLPLSIQYVVGDYPDATNTYTVTNDSLTSAETFTVQFSHSGASDVITLTPGASVTLNSPRDPAETVQAVDATGFLGGGYVLGEGSAQPYDSVSATKVINIVTGQITSINKVR